MLYHDHTQSLYTSCSACTGVLRKNTETDILVYGGNWVKEELFRYITACNLQSPKIILGDFNIDIKKNINHSFLQEMQQRFHLTQFIDRSTTFEGTTIDLVFSNLSDITAVALPNMWSSHHTLNITVPK